MAGQSNSSPNAGTLAEVVRTFQLVYRLMLDPRVPALYKLIIPVVLAYVISPIDLIPDMIPIAGQLDDIGVIFFGIRFFIQLCPPDVVLEHRNVLAGRPPTPKRDDYADANYRVVDDD